MEKGGLVMKIVIAGGTGLVGKRLQSMLKEQQAEIIILTSSGQNKVEDGVRYVKWMDGKIPEVFDDPKMERTKQFISGYKKENF